MVPRRRSIADELAMDQRVSSGTRARVDCRRTERWCPPAAKGGCARLGRAIVCGGHGPLAASSHREINLVERQPFRSFHRSLRPPGARDLPSCTLFSGLQHSWKCPYMDCEDSSIHGRCYQICRDCIWIVKCQSGGVSLFPAAEHRKATGDSSCTKLGHLSCSGLD